MSNECYSAIISAKNGDTKINAEDALALGIVDAIIINRNEMIVRADDPRIAYQNCYLTKLEGEELTEEQAEKIHTDCYNQFMLEPQSQ